MNPGNSRAYLLVLYMYRLTDFDLNVRFSSKKEHGFVTGDCIDSISSDIEIPSSEEASDVDDEDLPLAVKKKKGASQIEVPDLIELTSDDEDHEDDNLEAALAGVIDHNRKSFDSLSKADHDSLGIIFVALFQANHFNLF